MHNRMNLSLVPINKIQSSSTELDSTYLETELDRGAELILQVGIVINPIVIKPIDRGFYELVSGRLEYFCILRANKSDPRLMFIPAWIMDETNQKTLENQLALFRNDDEFEDDYFRLDFELVGNDPADDFSELDSLFEEDLDAAITHAISDKGTIGNCFAVADRLCQKYPDEADRNNAIAELESIKERTSGDRTYQDRLDRFFAETGGIYE